MINLSCVHTQLHFAFFQLADGNETEKSGVLSFPLNSLPLQKEIILEEVSAVNLLKYVF